jgi:uncharacterized protein with GYD domain
VDTALKPLLGRPFDGVILGQGSFTHVVEADDREALLRALARIAPAAPVLISYNARYDWPVKPDPGRRVRALRSVLGKVGIRTRDLPIGMGFSPEFGFKYVFEAEEIVELAAASGYRVERSTIHEFPHAVLVPVSDVAVAEA